MIRIPCHSHRWHDVDEVDAARIVVALTTALADESSDPEDAFTCPLEALSWACDVEVFLEHTEQALFGAQIIRANDDGEHVVVPWGARAVHSEEYDEAGRLVGSS